MTLLLHSASITLNSDIYSILRDIIYRYDDKLRTMSDNNNSLNQLLSCKMLMIVMKMQKHNDTAVSI